MYIVLKNLSSFSRVCNVIWVVLLILVSMWISGKIWLGCIFICVLLWEICLIRCSVLGLVFVIVVLELCVNWWMIYVLIVLICLMFDRLIWFNDLCGLVRWLGRLLSCVRVSELVKVIVWFLLCLILVKLVFVIDVVVDVVIDVVDVVLMLVW